MSIVFLDDLHEVYYRVLLYGLSLTTSGGAANAIYTPCSASHTHYPKHIEYRSASFSTNRRRIGPLDSSATSFR